MRTQRFLFLIRLVLTPSHLQSLTCYFGFGGCDGGGQLRFYGCDGEGGEEVEEGG